MFSLAALAAVAAMAIVGASSASANFPTTICLKSELVCEDASRVPVNSELHALATAPKLSTSLGTITCEKSDATTKNLDLLTAKGTPYLISLIALSFTNCELDLLFGGNHKCETKNVALGHMGLLKTGPSTASVTSLGTHVLVLCAEESLHCTYGGSPQLTVTTPASGLIHLTANAAVLTEVLDPSFICPNESKWTALYEGKELLLPSGTKHTNPKLLIAQ
jgi:hypothetical protein